MIDPSDFLTVANELATATEEAKLRTAISRAYYAAYHQVVKKYADREELALSDHLFGNHQNFIRELKTRHSGELKKIGNQLYMLKKDRFRADYNLKNNVTKSAAKKSCSASLKIITGAKVFQNRGQSLNIKLLIIIALSNFDLSLG